MANSAPINISMEIRILTSNDRDQYTELLNRSFFGKRPQSKGFVELNLKRLESSFPSSSYKVYGAFKEKKLSSAMAVHYWEKLPFYTIFHILTHPDFSKIKFYQSFVDSGLSKVMSTVVRDAEQDERWQFFYCTHLQNYKTRKVAWFEQCPELANRYDWYLESVVPANTLPKSEVYAGMMYNDTQPKDMVIKTARLKPDIIFNIMYDRNLVPYPYQELYPEKTDD
jgi:hypothetical protein